jgi:hypothetical protein
MLFSLAKSNSPTQAQESTPTNTLMSPLSLHFGTYTHNNSESANIFIINWIVNGSFLSLFPHISTKTTLNICACTISTTLRSLLGLVNFMVSALGNISSLPLHSHPYGIWMPCRL